MKSSTHPIYLETHLAKETLTSLLMNDMLNVRLFSARCRESQTQDLVNQDYILVNAQRDGSSLCFCVCDGVGNSFRGEFAARFLSTHLVQWLQTLPILEPVSSAWKTQLNELLQTWAEEAHEEVLRFDLPPDAPTLVREVLEELRATRGSETVFLCGRINQVAISTASATPPTSEIFLCWMGNVTAHLFVTADNCIILGGKEEDAEGWSTGRGLRGKLSTWYTGLITLEQMIVHTDGLDRIQRQIPELDNEGLQRLARRLLSLPQNDDMTALILQWLSPCEENMQRDEEERGS